MQVKQAGSPERCARVWIAEALGMKCMWACLRRRFDAEQIVTVRGAGTRRTGANQAY